MTDHSRYTDRELFLGLTGKDPHAFAAIYNRYWEVLLRHALRMLRDEENARDMVQDVFTTLWDKKGELDGTGSLSGYLYSALRNRILNFIDYSSVRKNHVASLVDFASADTGGADDLVRERELAAAIEREVEALPERMRAVFRLSRNEHKSYREIAEELDIAENTVKVQISKALTSLRKILDSLIGVLL